MLKLSPTPAEPAWIDLLPGVRVQVAAPRTIDAIAARDAGVAVWRDRGDADEGETSLRSAFAMTTTYARRLIRAWEGIGDSDGQPIEPTPEAIDQAMTVWPFFEAFDNLVVRPALTLDAA